MTACETVLIHVGEGSLTVLAIHTYAQTFESIAFAPATLTGLAVLSTPDVAPSAPGCSIFGPHGE